jgi:N6-adenosine-specific RNA methylase IME4
MTLSLRPDTGRKRAIAVPTVRPITIGAYSLLETGLEIRGRPSYENHVTVGAFIQRAHKASGWWLADWLRYGDTRGDWHELLDQAVEETGLTIKTLKNVRAVAAIAPERRRADLEFGIHEAVAALSPDDQTLWLEKTAEHGWNVRELRLELRASRRRRIIEGQAVLEGLYRVVYADPPWLYGNKPPSGSGAQSHYPGMTIEQLCKLPVEAHTHKDAVLFMWVTAPMLYEIPGPREVIVAWGFTPKTGRVWDKVEHNFGNYISIRHEHLIIATRGSCTPDRPTPMLDSVVVERQEGEHSAKPASFRKDIERLYNGPYLELFGIERVEGWDVFGNDAALWHEQVAV